jgi:hypothetical protein
LRSNGKKWREKEIKELEEIKGVKDNRSFVDSGLDWRARFLTQRAQRKSTESRETAR